MRFKKDFSLGRNDILKSLCLVRVIFFTVNPKITALELFRGICYAPKKDLNWEES